MSSASAATREQPINPHGDILLIPGTDRATRLGPTARMAAGIVATAGWLGLGLQAALMAWPVAAGDAPPALTLLNFFSFFTILSNVIVASVLTAVAAGRAPAASRLGAATLYIAVVGITYSVALRHIWNPQGWQLVADRLLHDAVPVLAVLVWLYVAPKGRLGMAVIPAWLIFPVAYLGWSLARGAVDGWYPYYFIDAGKLGYAAVARNAVIVTVLFGLVALVIVGLDRVLGRRRD